MATKQQIAQAKARAGGNNPIKVTNKGLKKLGGAALIAASFTPAGRVAKGVATVAKAASGARKASTVAKAETTTNARGLKAATGKLSKGNQKLVKQVGEKTNYIVMDRRPTPPSIDKILKTNKNFGAFKAPEQVKEGMKAVYAEGKKIAMKEMRTNSAPKNISPAQKMLNDKTAALRAAKNKALANSAKGKTQTPTAEAARRRNLSK